MPAEERAREMAGFDAQEAKVMMQQAFQGATRPGNPDRAILYKAVNGAAVSSKSASPWGAKANQMANGQDFFVQLRKGVAALQHPPPRHDG